MIKFIEQLIALAQLKFEINELGLTHAGTHKYFYVARLRLEYRAWFGFDVSNLE